MPFIKSDDFLPGCSGGERVDCAECQLHLPPGGGDGVAVVDDRDGLDEDGRHLKQVQYLDL